MTILFIDKDFFLDRTNMFNFCRVELVNHITHKMINVNKKYLHN